MADIDEGEILWIHPHQWSRSGYPDGFALRVVDLLGRDGTDPSAVWVRGVALDRVTGLPVQEIVLVVPVGQTRATRLPPGSSAADPSPPDFDRDHLVVGNRRYRRVH